MATLALNSYSKDFEIQIDNEKNPPVVKYVPSDWVKLKHENDYMFYLSNSTIQKTQSNLLMIYTLLIFDKPRAIKDTDITIEKIYSFGLLDCDSSLFSMIGELYTDPDGVVHQNLLFEEGEYVVKMNSPGTARHEAYLASCVDKRI
jgi:hypothetical protein